MRFLLISSLIVLLSAPVKAQVEDSSFVGQRTLQKFNPIFGSQREANVIISFIASNLVVELDPDQIKGIDGHVVCAFVVDTMGRIDKLSIRRSLRPWIDYAIVGAMKKLPEWGVVSMQGDRKVEKQFEIVFSFGTIVSQFAFGYQKDRVRDQTQVQIDAQRAAINKELLARKERWDGFTKENAKLRYDNRGALRNEMSTIPGVNAPLNPLDGLPSTTPTISINPPKE